jgi:hypothetical protein
LIRIWQCAYDSSEWSVGLNLKAAMIESVLDLLTRCGPELSEIVTAAADPASPAGIARRRALETESQDDQDDERGAALVPATEPSNLGESDLQPPRSVEKAAGAVHDVVVAATDDEVSEPVSRRMLCDDLSDCPNGNEHRLTVWATYAAADGLTVRGSDSTSWPCDDLEYTYHVAPEHIGRLRAALGAVGDENLLELLGQLPVLSLDSWLTKHGVRYSGSEKRHPN